MGLWHCKGTDELEACRGSKAMPPIGLVSAEAKTVQVGMKHDGGTTQRSTGQ